MARQDSSITTRARALRRSATEPEVWLWQRLRGRRLGGYRFRRQHPIGPYILDFYCPSARLAIEVDGSGHLDSVEADARRTEWLGRRGVHVLRLWNHEMVAHPESALQAIADAIELGVCGQLGEAPADPLERSPPPLASPAPPPTSRGEEGAGSS